ncbi:hypothetical protein MYE70_10580 [Marinobacter alexandrii]|uniref:hypothetical protein n=1 Tax=Marinobacter alexandrii TaxID=2570351 RepID=UPI001FFF6157|nr:hypothetical protein [Marinobacter alexandrii]MCK2149511.1 hypothetical protein [Marinobacter alexandrii]
MNKANDEIRKFRRSARVAWHDSFYIPKDDALSNMRGEQKATPQAPKEVGQVYSRGWYQNIYEAEERHKSKKQLVARKPLISAKDSMHSPKDFFEGWDAIWRSKVQGAIKRLPRVLKSFGAIMYSPTTEFSTDDCENVHEALQMEFFRDFDKEELSKMQAKRIVRLKLLMYAAMRHHRDVAFGGGATLGGPKAISQFLYHMYAERLPDTDQWNKRWQPDWEKMLDILDTMERKALSPVAQVLSEMEEKEQAA